MRAEDGRGADTVLRPASAAYFGLATVSDAAIGVHQGRIDEDELRGLTTVLVQAAPAGDPLARDPLERQAEEVVIMARTVIRRLGLTAAGVPGTPGTSGIPVVLGGGLRAALLGLGYLGAARTLSDASALPPARASSPAADIHCRSFKRLTPDK